jgi:cytidine deaminase
MFFVIEWQIMQKKLQRLRILTISYVPISIFMLKSYIRYVRSQIFPRINVEKLIYPYEAIGEKI